MNKLEHLFFLDMFWFSSDEKKYFYQDQMVNSQNNFSLALSSQDVLILLNTKYQVHIMVCGVVMSNSDVMPPFIFLHDLRLNMEDYTKCLEEVVLL